MKDLAMHRPTFWIDAAAKTFFISKADLLSFSRDRETNGYRMAAMWCARHVTGFSYPALARLFGREDHTTIMNAIKRVEEDERLAGLAEEILEFVESGMDDGQG